MPRCGPRCLLKSLTSLLAAVVTTWQLLHWSDSALDRWLDPTLNTTGVNPHPFNYILSAQCVCEGDVYLLIYVHSAPHNHRRRTAIRNTWGDRALHHGVRLVFLLGSDPAHQEALQLESDLHGDLVQEDFVDSYRNLTYKAILGLRWTAEHCPHARYVLKTDDDVYVNIFGLITKLEDIDSVSGLVQRRIYCLLWTRMKVMRNPKSKWYVARSEFAPNMFPPYCSGLAFVFAGGHLATELYHLSFRTPFFWIDDFYLTGLLAHSAGVSHQRWNEFYEVRVTRFYATLVKPVERATILFGHVHSLDELNTVWALISQNRSNLNSVLASN